MNKSLDVCLLLHVWIFLLTLKKCCLYNSRVVLDFVFWIWWAREREITRRRERAFRTRARSDHDPHAGGVNGSPGERTKYIQRLLVTKVRARDHSNN
jgi:hypothetical protein